MWNNTLTSILQRYLCINAYKAGDCSSQLSFPRTDTISALPYMCALCLNLKWAFEMLLRTVLEGHDKWDSSLGQHRQSKQCWCCVPPSENNSGSKCLLPFREFSTHLHPSPINCLVYLHLAVQAKWEFALKGRNVSLLWPRHHFLSLHLYV